MTPSAPTIPAMVYLSADQAAAYVNLSPRTLERMRSDGGGPRFKKLGKRIRYTKEDLDAWANARSFEATFDPNYPARRG